MKSRIAIPIVICWIFAVTILTKHSAFLQSDLSWLQKIESPTQNNIPLVEPAALSSFLQRQAIHLFGSSPETLHLLSIITHAAACLALMALLFALSTRVWGAPRRGAVLFATLFFGLLPVQIGTISLVTGYPFILSSFFLFSSLALFFSSRSQWQAGRLIVSAVLYFLAAASHPLAIFGAVATLIPLPRGKEENRHLRLVATGTILLIAGVFITTTPLAPLPLLPQGLSVLRHLEVALFPSKLALEHSFTPGSSSWQVQLQGWLIVGLALLALFAQSMHEPADRSKHRPTNSVVSLVAWGAAFFTALIVGQNYLAIRGSLLVESHLYVASAGIAVALMALAAHLTDWCNKVAVKPLALTLISIAPLAGYSAIALERAEIYGSETRLWDEVLAKDPNFTTAANVVAALAQREKNFAKAKGAYEHILAHEPQNINALNSIAALYSNIEFKGADLKKAETYLKQALAAAPKDSSSLENLARLYHSVGRADDAIEFFKKTLEVNPTSADVHFQLGVAYANQSKIPEALESLNAALRLNPNHGEAKRVHAMLQTHQATAGAEKAKGHRSKNLPQSK
jgi:tetratricopeptide (TPR) repeat protein